MNIAIVGERSEDFTESLGVDGPFTFLRAKGEARERGNWPKNSSTDICPRRKVEIK